MPYGMPNILMQGPVLEDLDTMLNKNFRNKAKFKANLQGYLASLNNTASRIPDLLVNAGVIAKGSPSDLHVRSHWFPDPAAPLPSTAWWPGLQLIEPITKLGYANAIQENLNRMSRREKRLRFDSYWACIPDWDDTDPEYYQVAYTVTPRQITIIIFTPPEPKPQLQIPVRNLVPEPVFFVKRPGELKPGLREVRVCVEGEETIGLYQIWRLHNKANKKKHAKKKARSKKG